MVEHALVAMDGSEQSWKALEYALREFPDAALTVLHVIDPIEAGLSARAGFPAPSEEWYEHAREDAEEMFEEAAEAAGDRSLSTVVEHGRPTTEIVRYAEDHDVDQVVMGSHGRSGVSRILLGSVAEAVVRRSPVPVTVVR